MFKVKRNLESRSGDYRAGIFRWLQIARSHVIAA